MAVDLKNEQFQWMAKTFLEHPDTKRRMKDDSNFGMMAQLLRQALNLEEPEANRAAETITIKASPVGSGSQAQFGLDEAIQLLGQGQGEHFVVFLRTLVTASQIGDPTARAASLAGMGVSLLLDVLKNSR